MADGYAWLADAQQAQGNLQSAFENRTKQHRLLDSLLAADPLNNEIRTRLLYNDLAIARIDSNRAAFPKAIARLDQGRAAAVSLEGNDPTNADIAKQARMFELFKIRTLLELPTKKHPSHSDLIATLGTCEPVTAALADDEIGNFCKILVARILSERGDRSGARQVIASMRKPTFPEVYSKRWGINFNAEVNWAQVNPTYSKNKVRTQ